MKNKISILLTLSIILTLLLAACELPLPTQTNTAGNQAVAEASETETTTEETNSSVTPSQMDTPEDTPEETETPTATEETSEGDESPTPEETVTSTAQTYGPTDFPENINPLTGLPVDDPALLKLPPALISISNFPSSARPQAGINTSPIVFEMAVGEGMTRFLALFYGGFPELVSGQTEGQTGGNSDGSASGGTSDDGSPGEEGSGSGETTAGATASIGPIRSGRLPYEGIRSFYSGFLVMASAYSGVAQTLNNTTSIYGSDSDDINSALIDVNKLYAIAQSRAEGYPGSNFSLEGMKFSPTPPESGQAADQVWIFYSNLNQVQWLYDEELGAYVRYDIKTDGSGEFVMATDRLSGEPVSRENVIVIFAEHDYIAPTLINIQLTNMPPMKALLFRDGEMHEIFWTTRFGEYEQQTGLLRPMRFVDAEGNPVALKPGYTWVEIVSTSSYSTESELSATPFFPIKEAEGTGLWLVRYKGKY